MCEKSYNLQDGWCSRFSLVVYAVYYCYLGFYYFSLLDL